MAAILPFLETEEFHFPDDLGDGGVDLAGLGGANLTDRQMIAASNSELTRLFWMRSLVQNALVGNTFQLVADERARKLEIRLGKAIPKNVVPWQAMRDDKASASFFSTNSKMRCPTFDLPAGAGQVGGACPAAAAAQVTSIGRGAMGSGGTAGGMLKTEGGRKVLALYPDVPFAMARTVCASCYATGGSYGQVSVQASELIHLAVMQAAIRSGNEAMREALIDAMVWQIPILPYEDLQEGKGEVGEGGKIVGTKGTSSPEEVRRNMKDYPRVVRVHSSGDFFAPKYADLWLEVARRVQAQYGNSIILWAPTRTSFLPTWARYWAEADIPSNFVIRPSAYHVGDAAPMSSGLASGTSVLTEQDSRTGRGEKYDHQCGVYDLGKGQKSCVEAMSPPGPHGEKPQKGCRACWVRPELRINYVAH